MSSDTKAQLEAMINRYGAVTAKAYYSNYHITFVGIGIQLFMVLYGVSLYLETPQSLRKGRLPFILVSFAILALSAWGASMDAWFDFETHFGAGAGGRAYLASTQAQAKIHPWYPLTTVSTILAYTVIGDGLMLYRCFVLWRDKWWFVAPVAFTYVCSFISGVIYITPLSKYGNEGKMITHFIWVFLSVSVNLMVTGLMLFRLIRARRDFTGALPNGDSHSTYSGVIAIIIESAAPLAVFGLVTLMAGIVWFKNEGVPEPHVIVLDVMFSMLWTTFSAISPQMIIFRVTTQRSFVGNYDKKQASLVFSRPPEFARDTRSDTDSDMDSSEGSGYGQPQTASIRERNVVKEENDNTTASSAV